MGTLNYRRKKISPARPRIHVADNTSLSFRMPSINTRQIKRGNFVVLLKEKKREAEEEPKPRTSRHRGRGGNRQLPKPTNEREDNFYKGGFLISK